MPQLLSEGFPDGAIRIGSTVSVLKKDGGSRILLALTTSFRTPRQMMPGAESISNDTQRGGDFVVSL